MDVIIETSSDTVSADEITATLTAAGYYVASVTIIRR